MGEPGDESHSVGSFFARNVRTKFPAADLAKLEAEAAGV
jgi:hypothetical protein